MLDGAKLQIGEGEVKISCLTNALREAANKVESTTKKKVINYQQELYGTNISQLSIDKGSSQRRRKKARMKSKGDRSTLVELALAGGSGPGTVESWWSIAFALFPCLLQSVQGEVHTFWSLLGLGVVGFLKALLGGQDPPEAAVTLESESSG